MREEGEGASNKGDGGISYVEVDPSRHHAYVCFQIFVKNYTSPLRIFFL